MSCGSGVTVCVTFQSVIQSNLSLGVIQGKHKNWPPTLFNIKINNIVKCVNDIDSSLYVDDFGIFYKSKNMENIEFRLQRCLNKVETWATENGFKFSKTKPSVFIFVSYGVHIPTQFLIFMDRLFLLLRKLSFWVFCLIRNSVLFLT